MRRLLGGCVGRGLLAAGALALLGWAGPGLAAETAPGGTAADWLRFDEICDASAVVVSGGDRLLVADEARNRLLLYGRDGGAPLARLGLAPHLKNRRFGGPGASGIEAAARVGDMIYLVTSHARTHRGRLAPQAHRFFAMQTRGVGEVEQIRPYEKAYPTLARDMEQDEDLGLAESLHLADVVRPDLAPDRAGIDIQGLAAARDDRGVLLGLRSPLRDGKAVIVPFLNPDRVVAGVEAAAFGDPVLLDLGGRGIVSLEWVPGQHTYFVLASPPRGAGPGGPEASVWKLYRWSGDSGALPIFVADVGRGDLQPKAMTASRDGASLMLLSDDGDRLDSGLMPVDCNGPLVDGDKCPCRRRSSLQQRYTRGRWIDVQSPDAMDLAAPVPPPPLASD